jgi:hypothetical protein
MLFFYPWTNESSLYPEDFDSCWNLFQTNTEIIDNNKERLFPHKNNISLARELIAQQAKNSIGEQLDANNEQQNEDDEREGTTQNPNYRHLDQDFPEEDNTNLPERSKYKPIDITNIDFMLQSARQLSRDQRVAFNLVLNFCKSLIKHAKNPEHPIDPPLLMIHGGAGTGKSKLIQDICKWAEHTLTTQSNRTLQQPYIIRVALTGKAASLIDGITIHSAFNFRIGNQFHSLADQTRDKYRTMLQHLKIVIIDEISMVKADLLYQLNLRLQEIKQNKKIFGGISILLLGDLMQLQPVLAKWIFDRPASPNYSPTYDLINLWQQFQVIELTKIPGKEKMLGMQNS